ncbi:Rv3654c family TadE-like protein [Demequina aurantiaca]|uniref:Rv3654c family TadE-like protein n=1 Tax=Demequina aurantiaca TaxID=676200 RepID=UPI003D348FEA
MSWRDDRGAGSLLAIGLLAVVGMVAMMAAALGGVAVVQVRAQGVADLAALTGAHESRATAVLASRATGSACDSAGAVAQANGARVESCLVSIDTSVQVEVRIATAWGQARASARAGPG